MPGRKHRKIILFIFLSSATHLILAAVFFSHWDTLFPAWSGGHTARGIVEVVLRMGDGTAPNEEAEALQNHPRTPSSLKSPRIDPPTPSGANPKTAGQGSSPTPAGGLGFGDERGSMDPGDTLRRIRQKILRAKLYPLVAQRKKIEGAVILAFKIGANGKLISSRIVGSSGHDILDKEGLLTLKRAAPFPHYLGEIEIELKFELEPHP